MFGNAKKTRQAVKALQAELVALRDHVEQQNSALASERATAVSIADRIAALEGRVSGMGSELSRQLHELGSEIEELSKRADEAGVMEVVDALKAAQVRLATEQARYEITFRQDLAALANQLLQRSR
jgi:predicted  nucleic acid-binding Zn-ribbon protein